MERHIFLLQNLYICMCNVFCHRVGSDDANQYEKAVS